MNSQTRVASAGKNSIAMRRLKPNKDLLRIRINQAREALHGSLHEVPPGSRSNDRKEMGRALHALHVLWIERCQFTGGNNA